MSISKPRSALRRPLPPAFRRVWIVVLTARAAQFVEALLPLLLLQSIGTNPAITAAVLVAQQLGATLAYAAVGGMVRRMGLIAVLRWGLLGSAASVAALAIAQSAPPAAAAASLFGATSGAWRAAVQALVPRTLTGPHSTRVSDASAQENDDSVLRARAFGAIFWAANAGAIASAAAGAAGLPLRGLFTAQAATTAAAFLISFVLPTNADQLGPPAVTPQSQQPTPADLRHARRASRSLIAAFLPATVIMFQAFSGLAVAMPAGAYRQMVLVNAVVLVLGQPLTALLLRNVGATTATVTAVLAMAAGIAAQAVWPHSLA